MTNLGPKLAPSTGLPTPLTSDVLEFIKSLERIEAMLCADNNNGWATRVTRVKKIAEASDAFSIRLFLSFFGGMGSLNDLYLKAPEEMNEAFHSELIRAYELAKALEASEKGLPNR